MRWSILSLVFFLACSKNPGGLNKFSDPNLILIYNLKDLRATDSLRIYLHSDNPLYRREAALAFGSVQDTLASADLGKLLREDPDTDVRVNAAFALGQTSGKEAIQALIPALNDTNRLVVREALEALGKCIWKKDLSVLVNFQSSDTLLTEGLAWAFYRLTTRSQADSLVTKRVARLLGPANSFMTRLGAAHYFGRSSKLSGMSSGDELLKAAQEDRRPEVRMMCVSGFKHLEFSKIKPFLKNILTSEKDYRVRVNAIRVCQNFPLTETQEIVFPALKDPMEMVQVAASELIRNQSEKYPLKRISEDVHDAGNWRVKANLFGALLKSIPNDQAVDEMMTLYNSAPSYYKSALAGALGEARAPLNKKAMALLSTELTNEKNDKVVISSSASALVSINRREGSTIPNAEFLEVYKKAIGQGDAAVMGIIASALTDTTLHYKKEITDLQFLYDAKAKLKLPKDIESLLPLERAIAYLEGKERPKDSENKFNHPIPWDFVRTISSEIEVEIKTSKGSINLVLLVEEDPGSAANFVDLTNKKYFDGKFFHRVVPNFVVQAGCNRGDGYGSEDYSIRSEFSRRHYLTGAVGMASAGKDTEGTQWFITHCPTPHLDGKYSLFGTVKSGMETVDAIEVGDQILNVTIVRNAR